MAKNDEALSRRISALGLDPNKAKYTETEVQALEQYVQRVGEKPSEKAASKVRERFKNSLDQTTSFQGSKATRTQADVLATVVEDSINANIEENKRIVREEALARAKQTPGANMAEITAQVDEYINAQLATAPDSASKAERLRSLRGTELATTNPDDLKKSIAETFGVAGDAGEVNVFQQYFGGRALTLDDVETYNDNAPAGEEIDITDPEATKKLEDKYKSAKTLQQLPGMVAYAVAQKPSDIPEAVTATQVLKSTKHAGTVEINPAFLNGLQRIAPAFSADAKKILANEASRNGAQAYELAFASRLKDYTSDQHGTPSGVNKTVAHSFNVMKRLSDYYGSFGLAIIGTQDPELAFKMYNSGGPTNDAEKMRAAQLLLNAGYSRENAEAAGLAWNQDEFDAMVSIARNGRSGAGDPAWGGAQVVELPNREALNQQMTGVFQSLFKMDIDEGTKQQLMREITGSFMRVAGARADAANKFMGNYFKDKSVRTSGPRTIAIEAPDPNAQIMAKAKGSDLYKKFYKNKAEGVTEQEYQNPFERAAAGVLGAASSLDPTAVQAGMISGNVNDASFAAATSEQADFNSTFQGRLASTTKLIDSLT